MRSTSTIPQGGEGGEGGRALDSGEGATPKGGEIGGKINLRILEYPNILLLMGGAPKRRRLQTQTYTYKRESR